MSGANPPHQCGTPVQIAKQLVEGFGPQVRHLRRSRGMTQLDLSNASWLLVDHIGKLERGTSCPNLRTVGMMAAGLRVPLAHLVDPHGGTQHAEVPDPLGELVRYMRQRKPEDSALALSLLRQVFDRCG